MNARRAGLAAVLLIGFAAALRADHPNVARGFDIGKPFQTNGIDNINLFNGNLTVTVPIGQSYQVNGGLSYGLTLVYSGNVWDPIGIQDVQCGGSTQHLKQNYPDRRSNAGIGWILSLGRLFPGNQFPLQEKPPNTWYYETPDGALHDFYDGLHDANSPDPTLKFTRDGSYLRLKIGSTDRTVEFPDGTQQIFKEMQRVANDNWTPTAGTGVWRLTSMKDRFGNTLSVAYSSADATFSTPAYPEIWTMTDGSRTQMVYFISAISPYDTKLDHVSLSTFSGISDWRFGYAFPMTIVPFGNQGCGGFNQNWTVEYLTSVTLPQVNGVSQTYSMAAPDGSPDYVVTTDPTLTAQGNGHLKGIQLPTLGWIEWDYGRWQFWDTTDGKSIGIYVKTRRMVGADRSAAHTSTWSYTRQKSTQKFCYDPVNQVSLTAPPEQLAVATTTPEGVTTVNYFSTFQPYDTICSITSSFSQDEYSMPLTRGVSKVVDGKTRYLSQETYASAPSLPTGPGTPDQYRATGGTLVRSEWVEYELEPSADTPLNQRERAHVVVYGDDRGTASGQCGTACEYQSVTRYRFDGFGHYRQSSTSGNFPAGNFRTTLTNHPDWTLTDAWLLNTYTERCIVDESSERTTDLSQCTGTSGPPADKTVASKYCYNATTGFLDRVRTLNGAGSGNTVSAARNDVTTVYTALGTGNVAREDYYGGGDDSTAVSDDACTVALVTPVYSVTHTYASGTLATSRYVPQSGQEDPNFYSVNNSAINANTGLVNVSSDPSGQQTTMVYDVLGRVSSVTRPSGLATTTVSYTEATSSSTAKATATTGSVQATSIFDDFGRLVREERVLPSGTSARETAYSPSGWITQVSEWESTPTHFTVNSDFDAFGRPQLIQAPDYTATNQHKATVVYIGGSKVERTIFSSSAQSAKTTEIYDRQNRLQQVIEPDGNSTTTYSYDPADHLTNVSMVAGTTTQSRAFTYDKRGFLVSEQHPESGLTSYTGYDARGHAGKRLQSASASNYDLKYEHDAAERLRSASAPDAIAGVNAVAEAIHVRNGVGYDGLYARPPDASGATQLSAVGRGRRDRD
jgi:YD repeat-containing protein